MKCDSCRPGNGLLKTCSEYQRDKRERGKTNKGTVAIEFYYIRLFFHGFFLCRINKPRAFVIFYELCRMATAESRK